MTTTSISSGTRRQDELPSVSIAGSSHDPVAGDTPTGTQITPSRMQESQKTASDRTSLDVNSNYISDMQPNVISSGESAAAAAAAQPQPNEAGAEFQPQALSQSTAQSLQKSLQVPSTSTSISTATSTSTATNNQWLAQVTAQTQSGVRQRMSQASDQLDLSLRQLYASASSIAADVRPPSYRNIPGIVPYYAGRSIGPPPSYDDVINPYAPPPSYNSLFGQMREARKSSRGLLDLLRRLLIILVSTLGCTLLVAFMILIPFTMIIVGAVYIDDCRVEHIPAFLLVGGLVWASKNILHCYAQCRQVPSSSSLSASSSSAEEELAATDRRHPGRMSENLANIYTGPSRSLSNSSSSSNNSARHLEAAMAGSSSSGDGNNNNNNNNNNTTLAPSVGEIGDPITNLNLDNDRHEHQSHINIGGEMGVSTTLEAHAGGYNEPSHQRQTGGRRLSSRRLRSSICESLLNCVLFGWFIAGCVIVFRNYEPDFENPASLRYCHKTVYMYTLWLISSAILLLGLFIGCICCLMVSSAVASTQDEALDVA